MRRTMIPSCLVWLVPMICAAGAAFGAEIAPPLPPVPLGGQWRTTDGAVAAGELAKAPAVPINGQKPVRFPLDGIEAGAWRVGFLVNTGSHVRSSYGDVGRFVLAVEDAAGKITDIARLAPPADSWLKPVRPAGQEEKVWAVWRGYAEAAAPARLGPGDRIVLRYSGDGSSQVVACRLERLTRACDMVGVAAGTDAMDHAFTLASPPEVTLRLTNAGNADWAGLLRVDDFDLMSEQTTSEFLPCKLPPRGQIDVVHQPRLSYGVHRLTARAAEGKEAGQAGAFSDRITVSHGPAKLARDLPDDWPLATHHYNPSPVLKGPMPGFKWYRYFGSWAHLNPRKGEYDWKNLDATIADLKNVGGRMLLTFEGAPSWTSKRATDEKATESRFAPDDMDDYRTFLRELVKRYADGGVLGAVEVWNEYNANLRWRDTWDKLVEMHKVTFEETRTTNGRIRVVGVSISPGHHVEYVENLTERGVLKYVDIVGGHFYEEIGSPNRLNPRNNMLLHVELLGIPIRREKRYLPIWDTESGMGWEGINGGPRPGGRMVSQDEMVKQLRARPNFDPNEPWLLWPASSERRMAARVVTGAVSLLGYGVEKHFTFHPNWYSLDGALNLPWVANATLGSVLGQVDWHYIMPLGINAVGGPADIGAVAWRIGKPGGKQVVVVWAERASTKHPHADGGSNWITRVPIQLPCAAGTEVTVQDMYLRTSTKVQAAKYPGGEAVTVLAGEEPVFVWDWKFRDQ